MVPQAMRVTAPAARWRLLGHVLRTLVLLSVACVICTRPSAAKVEQASAELEHGDYFGGNVGRDDPSVGPRPRRRQQQQQQVSALDSRVMVMGSQTAQAGTRQWFLLELRDSARAPAANAPAITAADFSVRSDLPVCKSESSASELAATTSSRSASLMSSLLRLVCSCSVWRGPLGVLGGARTRATLPFQRGQLHSGGGRHNSR
eukprot:COSAG01_NODE_78_length_28136_cov_10.014481_5_plen_204_part_00